MSKLLIVDTFYFMHRSFHAYPQDFMNSKGEHTNITFGLAMSLMDLIEELEPSHIVCAWESEEQPSFRKELYPQYQITRAQMEPIEEKIFQDQIPRVIELIESFNIPRFTENGFEGDDLIGTMATIASKEMDVVIATSDQDMIQLVNDKISVFRPGRQPFIPKMTFTPTTVFEKYGFEPIKMIDYKALRGDPSDNIPGVKGVGEKTAKALIEKFGTLDQIYAHIDEITPAGVKKKLETDKEKAFLSRQLATIITNIPIHFSIEDCEVHDFDIEKVRAVFKELEFSSLEKRLDNFYGTLQTNMLDGLPDF